jgi:hypothetical protein
VANNFQRSSGLLMDAIVSSKVVSGNADFFSVSGQDLTLLADATDPFVFNIGGDTYVLQSNKTLTVTNNAHNFIYIDPTKTLGRSATPPTYAYTAPGAPASGDFWYDLGKMQMKTYNGAAWVASAVVFIGYVRCDAATIDARYVCEPAGMTPLDRWNKLGDGSDGFLDVSAGTTTIDGTKQYSAVVVRGGTLQHTISTSIPGDSTCLTVFCQGVIAVLGSAAINLNGLGRTFGNGGTAAGSAGGLGGVGGAGGGGGGGTNGGGAGGACQFVGLNATGGSGTAGGAGASGGNASRTGFPIGGTHAVHVASGLYGAGGGGGGGDGSAGGNGGAGGGGMNAVAAAVALASGATWSANGNVGVNGPAANRGAGGGGGGGVLNLNARNFFMTGTPTVTAGNGGSSGGAGSGAGGNGSAGRLVQVRL